MVIIGNKEQKRVRNFWNNCIFHPTDAIEDSWGKRILDRMADDKSIHTVRIYAMLEDIVYTDGDGCLAYDFRVNDLRLDYLVEKGYDILISYGFMPECIASNKNTTSCVSKNKTRYKGKLINTSVPTDYKLWEEVCFEYTKHIVERYGVETVSKWHLHCWNEPDIQPFFLSDLPNSEVDERVKEYCKLYEAFVKGTMRVSESLCIGGPALAYITRFMEGFLEYVKKNSLRLDYIALHNYAGTGPNELNSGEKKFDVSNWTSVMDRHLDVIKNCGFGDTELVVDEWGMASNGFHNIEECPAFIARETEVYSAYYAKFIYKLLEKGYKISKLMICLSGQHEMVTDFSGFRNFFTLNFFAKPIYNAYILASKLYEGFLECKCEKENLYVVPTRNESGKYAVMLSYSSDNFDESLAAVTEGIAFEADIKGKKLTVYCIDKEHTNPYRLYERMGLSEVAEKDIPALREESRLRPLCECVSDGGAFSLEFSANSTYLITVE